MKLIQEEYEHNGLYITVDYSPKGKYVTVQKQDGEILIHNQPITNLIEILESIKTNHENKTIS